MTPRERYVDLLMGCLTRELFLDQEGVAPNIRAEGRDWPATAETMVGRRRLDNVRHAVETVLVESVPGDLIETGVWRGGVTILMRGILAAWEDPERRVWVADSFQGLPTPNVEEYPDDDGHDLSGVSALMVSADEVRANFDRYGLLDDRVHFLEGWFADTLAAAPIEQIAVLRLDGDLYESTMDALVALYDRVSPGGFVIVDDYGAWEPCRNAVEDFRADRNITDEIHEVDWTGVYWRTS